ncbi:MAG: PilZ domain-containing protein [Deltaproteobacteria bacterium]|nr:PilZ domain-containing protein [Deltaproteobacteria bacterium]
MRKPLHIGVELLRRGHDNPEFAIGADLSPSGALVFSDAALDPSDYVVLRFRLPWSDDRYAFLSEVVRVQPAPEEETGALFGFGLRFLDVSPSERLGLRQELQDLPPAVPWVPQAN